ncbi:peroxiredoxin-like family protein [Paraburkholderia azotifigens]|uniref:AhpC/TSA family protein n=1 Tax=Paraburkholderia azotifigens TaxID=2057004 RepID=A0A5C6V399_9BURK|nr:peroxiredoxin-like family protein [Paraburkholderia azotifigens]TXC79036.1 AhpC/TSA family protein [Paraburkholderia azotifigens]
MLFPRQTAPALVVDTLDHGSFDLASEVPGRMTLICFYRGLHCPTCAMYLRELERLTPEFAERGITTIAISSDSEPRAREMQKKVAANSLRIGYGLPLTEARKWGLYISTSRGKSSIGVDEPEMFSEPGLYLLRPDRTIYYLSVQSMPFVRPNFKELLQALDFAIQHDYPARGEYTGDL